MILHFREQSLLGSHFWNITERKMRFAPPVTKIDVLIISSKNEQNRSKESREIAWNVRSKIYFLTGPPISFATKRSFLAKTVWKWQHNEWNSWNTVKPRLSAPALYLSQRLWQLCSKVTHFQSGHSVQMCPLDDPKYCPIGFIVRTYVCSRSGFHSAYLCLYEQGRIHGTWCV